ncbi:MAG TPA: zf-TFIIB domain-containing protein [Longimicrobium sp.]|jgi:hypothetical protein
MKCPVCLDPDLVMTDRQGIEIDYCPRCRGVWLDRGELDKIIERSAPSVSGSSGYDRERESESYRGDPDHWHRDRDDDYDHRRKRRGGFLDDLFDFG